MWGDVSVKRRRNIDKVHVTQYLDYYLDVGLNIQLGMFPEGDIIYSRVVKLSNAYAKTKDLPEYRHVLHPKTTGFSFICKHLLNRKSLDAIYDLTMACDRKMARNELEMASPFALKEIQFKIKRYPIEELPHTEEGLVKWLQERWAEKEVVLKEFEITRHLSKEFWNFGADRLNLISTVIIWFGLSCE